MAAFKVNQIINDKPVNCIIHRDDKKKITKMEINGKKFGSENMGKAYMTHELKLTKEQVEAILTAEGEVVEAAATTKTTNKTGLKEGEEVTRTKAFRTSTTCIVIDFTEGLKNNKRTFSAKIKDLVNAGKPAMQFSDKSKLFEYLTTAYGIAKVTSEKMCKADTTLALTAEQFADVKAKIEAEETLEDVGILKSGTAKPAGDKKPREAQKTIEGYPSWVKRDPQDTIQFAYQMEAKNTNYSAKSNEAFRATNGAVKVGFAENLWTVIAVVTDAYKETDEGKSLLQRIEDLKKGDPTKNQADRTAEKRCAIFLAKALAGAGKLAFKESEDVEKIDPKVLGTKERRSTVYKR
jgi:hypothetical protein